MAASAACGRPKRASSWRKVTGPIAGRADQSEAGDQVALNSRACRRLAARCRRSRRADILAVLPDDEQREAEQQREQIVPADQRRAERRADGRGHAGDRRDPDSEQAVRARPAHRPPRCHSSEGSDDRARSRRPCRPVNRSQTG